MRCSCSFPQASTASINGTVRDQADAVIQNASVALQVQVSQKLTVDAVLKAGSSTTTVTVTDATPLVNVMDSTMSHVIDRTQIDQLPRSDRNVLNLMVTFGFALRLHGVPA